MENIPIEQMDERRLRIELSSALTANKILCEKLQTSIPAEDRYGRGPDKVKPLAQYLDEYIEHEVELGNISPEVDELFAYDSWHELLQRALDAYESTEQVKIRIEPV